MQTDTERIEKITLGNMLVELQPNGGYVTRWQVNNPDTNTPTDILYRGRTRKRTGIPILFPQFSSAPKLPKHGFGRDVVWECSKISENTASMLLHASQLSDEYRRVYPYAFQAVITIALLNERSFRYTLTVENKDLQPMPISPGLHPYWYIPHDQKRQMYINGISGFDAAQSNWDNNPPDTAYAYTGKTEIVLPDRRISIVDTTPGLPQIRYIVVWSQTPDQDDYDFVCVEPICGYNNALAESPVIVEPGVSWNMQLEFSVQFN